jgi:very-short-patch-repair endonuclease
VVKEVQRFCAMDDRNRGLFSRKRLERRRRELRKEGTAAEAVLWKYLQGRQILGKKFRRQHSIGPYIVDFYCPECRVIVELDGAPHDEIVVAEYDAERTRFLEQYGMKVIRFENRILYENPETALETIRQALLERS